MKNVICQFCMQDISNGNHAWNCEMNPVNINNNEFQNNNHKHFNNLFTNPKNLNEIVKNQKL